MERFFISKIEIEKVRHLKNISIPLSEKRAKHLIFTGKNGSGKTSVLKVLSKYLHAAIISRDLTHEQEYLQDNVNELYNLQKEGADSREIMRLQGMIQGCQKQIICMKNGINVEFNDIPSVVAHSFHQGQFVLAFYKAERIFRADIPKHIEKVDLQSIYMIDEEPRKSFVKYLLDLKVTEALSRNSGKFEKADEISQWFLKLQDLFRKIFEDESLELIFEEDTFSFTIKEKNREPFDFNTLSSGFAAVLDIVLDIIIRMGKVTKRSFDFNVPGIVLIDEIETHLHLELQKTILELLTTIFPNIQFIVSTHSPFVLNSLEDAVIYDLENNTLVENGLSNIPYSGIVEGYFKANSLSASLKKKYERYKYLIKKETLTDDEFEEIAKLELFLDEIPDYLALDITTEYQRLKMEFEKREDI